MKHNKKEAESHAKRYKKNDGQKSSNENVQQTTTVKILIKIYLFHFRVQNM